MKKIRLFVVDDHAIVREGFISLLLESERYFVSGSAANGKEALEKIRAMQFKPEVVLMDVMMPVMDGISCTAEITREYPDMKVIILTMVEKNAMIRRILEAGAVGFFLKSGSRDELYKAIDQVYAGKSFFTPTVSAWILKQMTRLREAEQDNEVRLSTREKEVLSLILKDCSNKQIADQLGISIRTVETHKQNLITKTGTRSVAGLVVYAMEHRLVTLEEAP